MSSTDNLVEDRYQDCLARSYRTEPVSDRSEVESLVREVCGDLCTAYVWAEGIYSAHEILQDHGGTSYWAQSETSRAWIGYYASTGYQVASDLIDLSDPEDVGCRDLALTLERIIDLSGGFIVATDGTCVLLERPAAIGIDELGALHAVRGPAWRGRDGWSLYCWHGILMKKNHILNPEKISLDAIKKERNQEVRRALIGLYGEAKWLLDTKAVPLDSDPVHGDLYRLEDRSLVLICSDGRTQLDGTTPKYSLRPNSECRPMTRKSGETIYGAPQRLTARNAAASTYGLTGEQYDPAVRT